MNSDEQPLIAALRMGDESAFAALLTRYQSSMVRVAMIYVSDRAVAEDVTQETWLSVLRGLDGFEGRSSLKTWIFSILTNRAKTRALREGRYVPLQWDDQDEAGEPTVAPERFNPPNHPRWPNHWTDSAMPHSWEDIPEDRFLSLETQQIIRQTIETLPMSQRQVITLHDIEGWPSEEICNILGISETNQRVLLHRARAKVRRALEQYLEEES